MSCGSKNKVPFSVAPGAKTRYARCGDLDIAYQVLGDGPLDILMDSGSSISIESVDEEPSMARFQRRLASFGRVIRYDRRGIGLSDRGSPSAPPSREDWVHDALAVLDAVGSVRAAFFAPFSAAAEGAVLASAHAERLSHLIIVNSAARAVWAPDYPAGIPQEMIDALAATAADPDAVELGFDVLALFAPSVASNPAFRAWWNRSGNLGATPAMARWIVNGTVTFDIRDVLPRVRVPTLVLHRTDIEILSVEHGRYLAEHIPGAKYVEIPGTDILYWVGDTGAMLDEIEEFITGVRGASGVERVLATVVFTDIVGSTNRAARLGDTRWRDLLDRHDQTVRRQIDRFRGREVKTVGDGFVATFDSPGRAIAFTLAVRDTLKALDIDVRAGIHTGEVEVRGNDVGGMAVHIGARVSAQAGPGEIMVSSTVKDSVVGSGMEFSDRGDYELKGVPGSWRIFAVTG